MDNRLPSPLPDSRQSGMRLRMGNFNILGWLGGGRFSSVYLAEALQTGRIYALKVAEGGKEAERHLSREAEALSGLSHPGIVKFYACEEVNGRPALVLEQVPGMSLRALLNEEKTVQNLTVEQIKSLLLEILKPVQYLHQHNIVHGDLKPENIAVFFPDSSNVQVKLLDLGLSGEEGKGAGTPLYMAPETYRGELTSRSDIWSIGIILFELLFGISPMEKLHPNEPLTVELLKITINQLDDIGVFPYWIFSGSRHHRGHECSQCLNFHGCQNKIYGIPWFCTLVNWKIDEKIKTHAFLQTVLKEKMLVTSPPHRISAAEMLDCITISHKDSLTDTPRIPQNRYEPVELIAEGRQHMVLRVRDNNTGREYSLLASPLSEESDSLSLFRSFCLLRTPLFPELHKHFQEAGRDYLLMGEINGRALKTLEKKSLKTSDILFIAHTLARFFRKIEGLPAPLVTPGNLIIDREESGISLSIAGPGGDPDEVIHYCEPGRENEAEPVWNIGTLLYELLNGYSPAKAFISPGSYAPLCSDEEERQEAVEALNRIASRGEGFPSYLFYQEESVDCQRCAWLKMEHYTDNPANGRLCSGYECRHGNFRVLRFKLPIPVALLLKKRVLLFNREKRCDIRRLEEELSRILEMNQQRMQDTVWIPPFTAYRLKLYQDDSSSQQQSSPANNNACMEEKIPPDFEWLPPTLSYLPSILAQCYDRLGEMRGMNYLERERFIEFYGWDDSKRKVHEVSPLYSDEDISKLLTEGHLAMGRQLWSLGYMKHAIMEYEKALTLDQTHQQVLEESVILNCLLDEVFNAKVHARSLSQNNQIKHLKSLYTYIESKTGREFRERTIESVVNEEEIIRAFE